VGKLPWVVVFLSVLLLSLMPAGLAQAQYEEIVSRARPAVVLVAIETNQGVATGSGFVVDSRGFIVTARHVVEDANRVIVLTSDSRQQQATLVRYSTIFDAAVLKIDGIGLPTLPTGDSNTVRQGQEVLVLGYPFATVLGAQSVTVTRGIVSALRSAEGLIQIDAALNPGNSGGPVLNTRGDVIGIAVAGVRGGQLLNFAVSINLVRTILADLSAVPVPLPSPPSSQPSPPSPPTSPPLPQPSAGMVQVADTEPIIIGYWLVVRGPDASLGTDSLRGIEIAIDDKGGALLGHPIQLIGENDGCNAEEGVRAATSLAANAKMIAAIGSSCSSAAVPGAPILWSAGIPTVSPSNTAPRLTDPARGNKYNGYLRVSHNDLVQGRIGAQFAFDTLGARRAATIHDGSPYAINLQAEFSKVFQQLGGTITNQEVISPRDTDMRPVLARITSGRPDFIYYPIFIAAGAFITRQARDTPGLEGVRLLAADGMFSPDFLAAAGNAASGMYLTSPDLSVEAMGPRYREFLVKHQRKYGGPPLSAFHAHAYDAAMMIFAAIEKVAHRDASGSLVIERMAVRDALFATRDFPGLTGTLTCNPYGDCGDPKIAVYQVVSTNPATWNPGINPRKVSP